MDTGHTTLRRRALMRLAGSATLAGLGLQARAANTLRIGQSVPLSGPLGAVLNPIVEGQKAVLDDVNARGGIHGNPIELITLDDAADPAATAANAQRLIDSERVIALFGFAVVPGLMRTLPLLAERKVPLLAVYNGADNLRQGPQPYLFTTTASVSDEVTKMVQTLTALKTTRLGMAFQDSDFGRYMVSVVEAIAKRYGASIVAATPLRVDGSNAAQAAKALAAAQPQAVLLLAAGGAVLGFLKESKTVLHVPVYALSIAGTAAMLDKLGTAARGMAVTQVVPYPMRQTTPLTRQFGAAMSKAALAPTYDRMWGFLNASILVEVLRRAGANPTPATIVSTIEHMGTVDMGGYHLNFNSDHHHGSSFVEITMVGTGGQYVR
jgi:branched-chain amino acid transport system substrate-binding protein